MPETTQFFRCLVCAKAYEMTEYLRKGNPKCKCGSGKFFPTILSPFEVFKYLLLHPKVLYATLKFRLTGRE